MGHLASYLKGYSGAFPGVKRQRHDVDPSPLPKAEVKKKWNYTSTPLLRLHGVEGEIIKRQCNEHKSKSVYSPKVL